MKIAATPSYRLSGQRSVVIRLWIRADHDVDDMVEELRARVQATYAWPRGLSLAAGRVDAVLGLLDPEDELRGPVPLGARRVHGDLPLEVAAERSRPGHEVVLRARAQSDVALAPHLIMAQANELLAEQNSKSRPSLATLVASRTS